MALSDFKKSFTGRATAFGLTALAALTPLTDTFAGDANTTRPGVTSASLTDEQRARVLVLAAASDYAMEHPGHIGISVLRGPDAGNKQGPELAALLERGIEGRYGIESEGYAGNNGNKPTEITYHYRSNLTGNGPLVMSLGPYNMGDAIANVPELIARVEATRQYSSLDLGR